MPNYAAGFNMGGYSADPDSIIITDDWQSAIHYLADTIDRWWDQDYLMADGGPSEADTRYLDTHTELHNAPSAPEYHAVVNDARGYSWHLWVVPTDEPVDD